jgi:uncharacterized protein
MNILLTGSTGLVGSALAVFLAGQGCAVTRLVRRDARPGAAEVAWDPASGPVDPRALEGFDAAVHLAGENIAQGRWTAAKKARIRDSRAIGTRQLCTALAGRARPPRVLVAASAVGIYGDRGDTELDETSPPGTGFLADVCRDWEAATQPAADAGVRVVHLRMGAVLSSSGGMLARVLPLFRWGLGGRLGSGRQYVSWITLDDVVRAVDHALRNDQLRGPVNAVSPQPVTNRQLAQSLGRVLRRPTLFPAPAFMLRLALGEVADQLLLSSARVLPRRLLAAGFQFEEPELAPALQRLLVVRRD